MDDRYVTIERELAHVTYALKTLRESREEFPLGAIIGDPAYWRARLQSIRGVTERYEYQELRDRADELLVVVLKLQYWTP